MKTVDLGGNAVTAAQRKDGKVKAAEIDTNAVGAAKITTDSVGAAELQGVTKSLFCKCVVPNSTATFNVPAGGFLGIGCSIIRVDTNDRAIASLEPGTSSCFTARGELTQIAGQVQIQVANECSVAVSLGAGSEVGIIVFDQ